MSLENKQLGSEESDDKCALVKDLDNNGKLVSLNSLNNLNQLQTKGSSVQWEGYWKERSRLRDTLLKAVILGNNNLLQESLQQHTIDLNSSQFLYSDNWSLLHHASQKGNARAVQLLLGYGIEVNGQTKNMRRTSLHMGVIGNKIEIVKCLIENGVDVNRKDQDNNTALHYALDFDYKECIELLIKQPNIDYQSKNNQGLSILDLIKSQNTYKLIKSKIDDNSTYDQQYDHVDKMITLRQNKNRINYIHRFINSHSDQKVILQNNFSKTHYSKKSCLGNSVNSSKWDKITQKAQLSATFMRQSMLQSVNAQSDTLNNYDILRKIGGGGFGTVYLARKKKSSLLVAIKSLAKKKIIQHKNKQYVYSQRNILKSMNHPFIIQPYSFFQDQHNLYIVMHFCNGGDIADLIFKRMRLPEEQVKKYVAEITLALGYLHSKEILFRDLKAANVLLDQQGHVKLIDFGLSKQAKQGYSFLGSLEYLAPEMLVDSNLKKHGTTIDWYTLGIITYEMLVGRTPFIDNNREIMIKKIKTQKVVFPKDIGLSIQGASFVGRLLKKNPEERLGAKGMQEVKNDKWFADIDWKKVEQRKLQMPNLSPKISTSQLRKKEHYDISEIVRESEPQEHFRQWNLVLY